MTNPLKRRVSSVFHRRPSWHARDNNVAESRVRVPEESSLSETPPLRHRPIFSLSSLSFRRPGVTLSPSASTQTAVLEIAFDKPVDLHIRNPRFEQPKILFEPSPHHNFVASPADVPNLADEIAESRVHARTVPPTEFSTNMHLYPRYLEVTTSSTSSTSRLAHVGHDDAPSSAFSDWGTSGAGTPSRTTSSQSLLSVELRDDAVSEISESGQEGANDSQQTPVGGFGRSENVVDKEQSKSESTTSDPYTSPACIVHDPALLKLELHHHHHSHSHHRHARHALLPKPTIADSSYPELAVAFFSSLTRSKARKLERRASTGSLGGAV